MPLPSPFTRLAFCVFLLGVSSCSAPLMAQVVLTRPHHTAPRVPSATDKTEQDQQKFLQALAYYEEKERNHLVKTQAD